MKATKTLYILLCSIAVLSLSCKKNNYSSANAKSVSVIGIAPCTQDNNNPDKKGYILYLNDTKETVLTFNLPQAVAQRVGASPKFKDAAMFSPQSVVTVNLSYHVASKDEYISYVCVALYISYSTQVVIDNITNQ
jgi:hypothetical protein